MNKRCLMISLAAAGAVAMMSPAALAQQAPADQAGTQTNAAQPAPQAQKKPAHKRAVPAPGDRACVQSTGSHIPPPKGQCLPVNGRSYSQQDIQRTGAANLGRALQMLDPAIQIHGH